MKGSGKIRIFKYWLIEKLAGDMPVLLNVNICRPKGFKGTLVSYPDSFKPGMIAECCLWNEEAKAIITPTRDVDIEHP